MMTRFVAGLWLWLAGALPVVAAELPPAGDFSQDARAGIPILVFFASSSCPYCRQVEELYLKPLYGQGTYAGKLLIRRVQIDGNAMLADFSGRPMAPDEFARREGVHLTPVVRLYGPDGRQIVPELLGYTTPDFYSGLLDRAIEDSIAQMRPKAAVLSGIKRDGQD